MPIVKPTIVNGIKKLYYALITTDDADSLIYATPVYLPGVSELGMSPQVNRDPNWAEDILWDEAVTIGSVNLSMLLAQLTSAQQAVILGKTVASAGGVFGTAEDEPPDMAILYKAPLRNGGFRYGVFYKASFAPYDETYASKQGNSPFAKPNISGSAKPTHYEMADGKHLYEYHVDTTDDDCPADIDDTWFVSVTIPSIDTTPPTVTVEPEDADEDVAVTANIVWTFSEAIDPNTVNDSNFFLMKADGTAAPGALSISTDGTTVTLDPTDSMTAATDYLAVCTTAVTDKFGNHLAARSTVNFTTLA